MIGTEYRPFQQTLADDDARFVVAVVHRRGGKTIYALRWLIDHCKSGAETLPIRDYFVCPYRNQAKGVAFDFLQMMTEDDDVIVNRSELYVEWPNGARLQLLGADGYDKHRGRYAHRVVFDETAQIAPGAWREVFRPMLADTKGKALFIGTPRGHGFFHSLYEMEQKSDRWSSHLWTVDDTGLLDQEELDDMRAEMTESEYRREMLCDWNVGAPGAYLTHEMDVASQSHRIEAGELWTPNEVVHTSWAIMPTDAVIVHYWQVLDGAPVMVDSDRFTQARIDQVVKAVREKEYVYESHCFRVVEHGASKDVVPFRLSAIRALGIKGPLVPRVEWSDDIAKLRQFVGRCHFASDAAADGVEALRQVRAEYNEERQVFLPDPVKDWAWEHTHATLAFAHRYRSGAGLGRREPIQYPEKFRA